jgi:hypothetical protein
MFAMLGMGSYQTHNLLSGPEAWNFNATYWTDNGDDTFTCSDLGAGGHTLFKNIGDKVVQNLVYIFNVYVISEVGGSLDYASVRGSTTAAGGTPGTYYTYEITAGATGTSNGVRSNGSCNTFKIGDLSIRLKR